MSLWKNLFAPRATDKEQLLESLLILAWVVEAKDPYTGGHLWRVSKYANLIAKALDLDEKTVARVTLGGFLHDLGKISVPDNILTKQGPLTDEEYSVIKTHPTEGVRLIFNHPLSAIVIESIGLHHERFDGKGYPKGMARDAIPIEAKIVAVCDAFDAMTSQRSYRGAMSKEKALAIIQDNLGTQFDPTVGERFIELGNRSKFDEIILHSDDHIPLHNCPTCGPTITQYRSDKVGSTLHCPVCLSQVELINEGQKINIKPTMNTVSKDQKREPDYQLIKNVIVQTIKNTPIEDLL
ncbi:HD-GYP domain-containing protein [Vibrio navarrensis]|nr:HD-GYP domain-containing protein [Vibrio navarrensis]